MIVIVRFDDSEDADYEHRITFWNGRRFVPEYPNATEYDSERAALKAYASTHAFDGEIAVIADYGLTTERRIVSTVDEPK